MKHFNKTTKINKTLIIITFTWLLLLIVNITPKSNLNRLLKYKSSNNKISDHYKIVGVAFYSVIKTSIELKSFKVALSLNSKTIDNNQEHTIIFCSTDFHKKFYEED